VKHFLIVYDVRSDKVLELKEFSQPGRALTRYEELEREFRDREDIQVVLVASGSLAEVKLTHGNLLTATKPLQDLVETAKRGGGKAISQSDRSELHLSEQAQRILTILRSAGGWTFTLVGGHIDEETMRAIAELVTKGLANRLDVPAPKEGGWPRIVLALAA
jgi:hypothetical protein